MTNLLSVNENGELLKSTGKSETVRTDYVLNHVKITEAFNNYINEHNRFPSNVELGELTGYSEKTIRKHLADRGLQDYLEPAKLLAGNVLLGLVKRAVDTGSPSATKLYFQLVFGWSDKHSKDKKWYEEENYEQLSDEELADRFCEAMEDAGMDLMRVWHERLEKKGKEAIAATLGAENAEKGLSIR